MYKYVNCPHCNNSIDQLIHTSVEEIYRKFWVDFPKDKEPSVSYQQYDSYETGQQDYRCPDCDEVIATDEEGAKAFLLGKK